MACATCSSGAPGGCQNTGACSTGGCNKLNTYDWLSAYDFEDPTGTDIIELSFKKGARKEFYRNHAHNPVQTKDLVVVDTGTGYDVGEVSLTGELVRLQLKKKRTKEQSVTYPVLRMANERDIERLNEYRALEKQAMVRARAISSTLGLDMKVCDVEYRGDGRKATFFYTAEGRVDFRELVRLYAKEFQVKVEMRQIGARQESARIGGIGSCGRELCCSTWLTDFKTVNTHAARYQNLSINQAKLSGQCGRLKCCLNYELDTYMEAIEEFPQDVDRLKFQGGSASLIKMDIFKRLLYYSVEVEKGRSAMLALSLERVKFIKDMNVRGQFPEQLPDPEDVVNEEEKLDFTNMAGEIELPDHQKKKNKKKKKGPQRDQPSTGAQQRFDALKGADGVMPAQRPPENKQRPHDNRERSFENKPRPNQQQKPRPAGPPQQPKASRSQHPLQESTRPTENKPTGGPRRNKNRNRNKGNKPGTDRPQQNDTPT